MLIYDPLFHGNTTPLRPMFLGGLLKMLKPSWVAFGNQQKSPLNKADFHLVPLALSSGKGGGCVSNHLGRSNPWERDFFRACR